MAAYKFHGLEAVPAPMCQNAFVVPGTGFEAYLKFAGNMDRYRITSRETPEIRTVRPDAIEDIRLSMDDVLEADRFWRQHMRGGTLESFLDIACHIPAVRDMLRSGADIRDLKRDGKYGPCAALYFDMDDPSALSAYEGPGFLWFQTNGRHRALAARILGHEIPVKLLGRIEPKGG